MILKTKMILQLLLLVIPVSQGIEDVDWRDENMSPIANQGGCGSCVGFAIAGALDWQLATDTGVKTPVSVQYMVDCGLDLSTGEPEDGCQSGVLNSEVQRIMAEQYLPYDEDYQYQGNFDYNRCDRVGARDRTLRNALADVWVHGYRRIASTPAAVREALQNGPTFHGMNIGVKFASWDKSGILTDDGRKGCVRNPSPHALTFVGWQSNNGKPYYIVRNSYGTSWGEDGYVKYADAELNEWCRYALQAYQLLLGKRREIEYQIGTGKKSFQNARKSCQALGDGWDLAHIPTKMHNFEVYDLFTAKYGTDKKKDTSFNVFWIGLFDKKQEADERWVWVDGDADVANKDITGEDAPYLNFKSGERKKRYGVMSKVHPGEKKDHQRGRWLDAAPYEEYRFVCSRYRKEECPRISQRAVENAYHVTFSSPGDGSDTKEIVSGTMATVECMDGYTVSGGPAVCGGDGQWSGMPTCVVAS